MIFVDRQKEIKMVRNYFLMFLGALVAIAGIAFLMRWRHNSRGVELFRNSFLIEMPFAIIVVVTVISLVTLLRFFWVDSFSHIPKKMWIEAGFAVFAWLAFFGKIVISKPKISKEGNKKYPIGLATIGDEPLPWVYRPGRHCIWMDGMINSDMILIDGTIGVFTHTYKGVPLFETIDGIRDNVGVADIRISFRFRVDFECPERTLLFLQNGEMAGAQANLISWGDTLLRDASRQTDYNVILEERGAQIVPILQTGILGSTSPADTMTRDGEPDNKNLGIRFFSIVVDDVQVEGIAAGSEMVAARFKAKANLIMAQSVSERFEIYQKAGMLPEDMVDFDLLNRSKETGVQGTITRTRGPVSTIVGRGDATAAATANTPLPNTGDAPSPGDTPPPNQDEQDAINDEEGGI